MKYHIWTEGCQMNVADSMRVASALEKMGYHDTGKANDADVIILNTCVVRQSAEDKAVGRLSSLRPLKDENPNLIINLMGCMVGIKNTDVLQKRFPYVDVFSPPSDPEPLVKHLLEKEGRLHELDETLTRFAIMDGDLVLPDAVQDNLVSSFVSVVLGCSHACTYCIIPYRRGVEKSRPPQDIMQEAQSLARQGVKEITLLGQIVDRYGKDDPDYPTLGGLIRRLHTVEGIERIRFLTSHPNYMTTELLDTVANYPKAMPHIEVPIQAGNDQVLENMRRGYTNTQYRELVAQIRERIPGVSIATDIIVGFPGETETQYQDTYDLLADLKLDVAHLARYSPREGTVSARRMPDDVPDEEKWRRFRALEELQTEIVTQIHAGYLDKTIPVLFEGKSKKGRWRGRTETNKLVFVESDQDLLGKLLPVQVYWTGPWTMLAKISA
ncbi:MAG: tRNA (N6-isopentenyl adenosine(37)-C2)-methylthiotransferase MiaB [Chloroflexi bacterium 44-23]|nr:MAG: tRNA (N6-isopentenyl adenosine(37)-C2)-methylthiotransferase MiaB [Chloroflexi bacterium 44-23]